MLLALSDVTYVLIGWFKFLLLKFLYEYGPWCFAGKDLHIRLDTIVTTDVLKALERTKPSGRAMKDKYIAWQREYESVWPPRGAAGHLQSLVSGLPVCTTPGSLSLPCTLPPAVIWLQLQCCSHLLVWQICPTLRRLYTRRLSQSSLQLFHFITCEPLWKAVELCKIVNYCSIIIC